MYPSRSIQVTALHNPSCGSPHIAGLREYRGKFHLRSKPSSAICPSFCSEGSDVLDLAEMATRNTHWSDCPTRLTPASIEGNKKIETNLPYQSKCISKTRTAMVDSSLFSEYSILDQMRRKFRPNWTQQPIMTSSKPFEEICVLKVESQGKKKILWSMQWQGLTRTISKLMPLVSYVRGRDQADLASNVRHASRHCLARQSCKKCREFQFYIKSLGLNWS